MKFQIFPIPFDRSIPTRPGARFGPERILYYLKKLHLRRDIHVHAPIELQLLDTFKAHERITRWIVEVADRERFPIFIGGDHSITYATVRAVKKIWNADPMLIINVDAHFDLRAWSEDNISSGTPFRRLIDDGIIRANELVEIGIKPMYNPPELLDIAERFGIKYFTMDRIREIGISKLIDEISSIVEGYEHMYVSLDIDAVDQSICPGSSASSPYGLNTDEVISLIDFFKSSGKLVAFDLVEVSPPWDVQDATSKFSAFILGRLMEG